MAAGILAASLLILFAADFRKGVGVQASLPFQAALADTPEIRLTTSYRATRTLKTELLMLVSNSQSRGPAYPARDAERHGTESKGVCAGKAGESEVGCDAHQAALTWTVVVSIWLVAMVGGAIETISAAKEDIPSVEVTGGFGKCCRLSACFRDGLGFLFETLEVLGCQISYLLRNRGGSAVCHLRFVSNRRLWSLLEGRNRFSVDRTSQKPLGGKIFGEHVGNASKGFGSEGDVRCHVICCSVSVFGVYKVIAVFYGIGCIGSREGPEATQSFASASLNRGRQSVGPIQGS